MTTGLVYFLAGAAGPTRWARLGLGHVGDATICWRPVAAADGPPDVGEGTVVAGREIEGDLPVFEWRGPFVGRGDELEPAPRFWIGWAAHERPPGPAELWNGVKLHDPERSAGAVILRDGRAWRFPILRPTDGRAGGLPRMFVPAGRDGSACADEAAQAETRVDPRYRALDEAGEEMLRAFTSGATISSEQMLAWASELLAVCYRVRLPELLALELLTPQNVRSIIADAIDMAERLVGELPETLRGAFGPRVRWQTLEAAHGAL